MPELPEVQTIITDLNKLLPGLTITGFWSDIPAFKKIKKEIIGRKIIQVNRRGKNILVRLSENAILLIHQKMTGHMLYGNWEMKNKIWKSKTPGPIRDDPQNRFIHLILNLSNGKQLALSDVRKFAKVLVWPADKLNQLKGLAELGPEPVEKSFIFARFKDALKGKRGKIKMTLMNQKVIVGIGNIYSDEILWQAGMHPFKRVEDLNDKELKRIFEAMKKIFRRAIKAAGDSTSDYRRPSGEKGKYQDIQNAYQMTGTKCKKKDGGVIARIKLVGRSAHFCPIHQKL